MFGQIQNVSTYYPKPDPKKKFNFFFPWYSIGITGKNWKNFKSCKTITTIKIDLHCHPNLSMHKKQFLFIPITWWYIYIHNNVYGSCEEDDVIFFLSTKTSFLPKTNIKCSQKYKGQVDILFIKYYIFSNKTKLNTNSIHKV